MADEKTTKDIQSSLMAGTADAVPMWVKRTSAGMLMISFALAMVMQTFGLTGVFSSAVSGYVSSLDQSTKNLSSEIGKLSLIVFRIEKLEDKANKQEAVVATMGSSVSHITTDVEDLKKRVGVLEGAKTKKSTDPTQVKVIRSAPPATPEVIWKMW
jgi:hypothetical protein